jgi:hypothetical protein
VDSLQTDWDQYTDQVDQVELSSKYLILYMMTIP